MSLKFLVSVLSLLVIYALTNSCSKSASSSTPPIDSTTNSPNDTSSIIIYIGGDTTIGSDANAAYWKNGLMTKLPIGPISSASCIYVNNNDVYITAPGSYSADSVSYWKNNQAIALPDTLGVRSPCAALTISGGDVYATGTEGEYPYRNAGVVYWKNNDYGVHPVPLAVPLHVSSGRAIAVSNGDVYIAGYLDSQAVYWKNGIAVPLTIDTVLVAQKYSIANSVCINQGNVYVAGTINLFPGRLPDPASRATYWKNNTLVRLTRDTGSVANAIVLSGNDIYVAGGIFGGGGVTRAAYWKNGKLFLLNSNYSVANAIAVYGTDVFIAGTVGDHATYWKNGSPVSLGPGHAHSIFIVHK